MDMHFPSELIICCGWMPFGFAGFNILWGECSVKVISVFVYYEEATMCFCFLVDCLFGDSPMQKKNGFAL